MSANEFKFVKSFIHHSKDQSVKLIALMTFLSSEALNNANNDVFDSYLIKPLCGSSLCSVVNSLFYPKKRIETCLDLNVLNPEEQLSAHILIAEDNAINQNVARKTIEKLGHSVVIANDGYGVLEILETESFDMIFMDMQMPNMGGLETTEKIRNLGIPIPIVAMTANVMKGDRESCLKAGMDDYLSKPIKQEIVSEMIIKHCSVKA